MGRRGTVTRSHLITVGPQAFAVRIWPKVSLAEINNAVINYYGITKREFRSKRRIQRLVRARQVAAWLAWRLTDHDMVEIGRELRNTVRGKNRSTISSGIHRIANCAQKHGKLADDLQLLLPRFPNIERLNHAARDELAAMPASVTSFEACRRTAAA